MTSCSTLLNNSHLASWATQQQSSSSIQMNDVQEDNTLAVVAMSLFTPLSFLCTLVFTLTRNQYEQTSVRSPFNAWIAGLTLWVCLVWTIVLIRFPTSTPCWVTTILPMLIPILQSACLSGFLTELLFFHRLSLSISTFGQISEGALERFEQEHQGVVLSCIQNAIALSEAFNVMLVSPPKTSEDLKMKNDRERLMYMSRIRFVVSIKGQIAAYVATFAPFVPVVLGIGLTSDPVMLAGCVGCDRIPLVVQEFIFAYSGVAFFGAVVPLWLKSRNIPDPLWHRFDAAFCGLWSIVAFGFFFSVISGDSPGPMLFATNTFLFVCVFQASIVPLIIGRTSTRVVAFTKGVSDIYKISGKVASNNDDDERDKAARTSTMWGGENSTSGHVLVSIRQNPTLLALFREHLVAEFAIENIEFLDSVDAFKSQHPTMTPSTRLARARRIYKSFVEQGAMIQVNLPSIIAEQIHADLFKQGADASRNVFDQAVSEIERVLAHGALARFVVSSAYRTAVASIIATTPQDD